MKILSLTTIAVVAVFAYVCHTVYVIYGVWNPSPCPSNKNNRCVLPYKPSNGGRWNMKVYCTKKKKPQFKSSKLIWEVSNIDLNQHYTKKVEVNLPSLNKLTTDLYLHTVLYEDGASESGDFATSKSLTLTKYSKPVKYFKLVSDNNKTESDPDTSVDKVLHWHSKVFINVMHPPFKFDRHDFPNDILMYIKPTRLGTYLPILFIDELSLLKTDLKEMKNDMTNISVEISYSPISIGKLRLWNQLMHSLNYMKEFGFTDEDMEEVRGIFTDTNIWFLTLTFFVSTFHLLFDFLAFKHDVNFWMHRDSMTGLSFNTVMYRCISTIIIFFYLMSEKTSYLVLVPAGIGSLIEIWKVTRALKVNIIRNGWRFQISVGNHSKSEQTTENYDHEAIKYLSYVLYPLIVVGAIYSLFYVPHRSWYSWLIHSLANGVYAFGFLFMLPQLFINYKMKSVAHLPWKAFTYKAFNTFIDDVFAFIIKMPTSHRIACFRDDIVFFCYLYQRWLYPVDKTRVNEFGISYDDEDSKKNK